MKILLSAYACEPNKGSEPGVGWHWAIELSRLGHEVWVLTRANNQANIEQGIGQMDLACPPVFVYYDLPCWLSWWKRGSFLVHPYYLLWQWGAFWQARKLLKSRHFDVVHHVTFGVLRQPSLMGNLGIPFIFGPAGGGERAPWPLRKGYGLKGWIMDWLRDLGNFWVRLDPLMVRTYRQARTIYIRSADNLHMIPKKFHAKVQYHIESGMDPAAFQLRPPSSPDGNQPVKLLFVGRFIYWKGMHLGLRAFARLCERRANVTLTMIGRGPDEQAWRHLAQQLGIADRVAWIPWVLQEELPALYQSHDIFFFPSLHDSSPGVLLEAMASGLPVACLKLGGPGVMVPETAGLAVEAKGKSEDEVIAGLADSLECLVADPARRAVLSAGARTHSESFRWAERVKGVYPSSITVQETPSDD